jgi:hypothetical protein
MGANLLGFLRGPTANVYDRHERATVARHETPS